jgi:8-oxo-dGTP pyrophosphatase MutT (NUDIX family)
MMDKTKFIKSSIKYKGKFLSYYEKEFEINNNNNNNTISWECVDYNSKLENPSTTNAISIIPIFSKSKKFLIIGIFRYPVQKYSLEFPSGLIDKEDYLNSKDFSETLIKSALRELKEETGYLGTFKKFFTPNGLSIEEQIQLSSNIFYDPWKSMDNCVRILVEINEEDEKNKKECVKQNLDECEIIKTFSIEKNNLLNFIKEKVLKENYTCSTELYNFALGIELNNLL